MYVHFYHRSCTQCFDLPWLLLSNLCPHEATRIDVHGEFDWLSELICKGKLIWGGRGGGRGGEELNLQKIDTSKKRSLSVLAFKC